MTKINWQSGKNGYRKHSFELNTGFKSHTYSTELTDVETTDDTNIHHIFEDILSVRQNKTVEVLYSGGLDSECVLVSCLLSNIPVTAITMRLLVKGYPINTHDLYYSEKFCRERGVNHKIVDLNVDNFFINGDHVKYLEYYHIDISHVATHLWLFEQCTGFPVLGGEYSWPQSDICSISPHRYAYSCYDRFLTDKNIFGIGNMLSHSIEANIAFIKGNLLTMRTGSYQSSTREIPLLKQKILSNMGFGDLEIRMRSYGWENIPPEIINKSKYSIESFSKVGVTRSSITWGQKIADALGGEPGTNSKY